MGSASIHVIAHAIGTNRKNRIIPTTMGISHASAEAAHCSTNAKGTRTPACERLKREAATPTTSMHQARPIAMAEEPTTSSAGELTESAMNATRYPAKSVTSMTIFRRRTCKSAGLKVAIRPITSRDAAFTVTDMSRA